jgi:BirA family biotin operon repressor/biotin-[acetyl-CoA-carboxylase] ligase
MTSPSLAGYSFVSLLDSVDSTMRAARAALSDLHAMDGRYGLIVAREQTAGRGRQGRSWSAAKKSFMGTFIFKTELPVGRLAGYSLAVGVAVAEALGPLGAHLRLKWPNYLVVPDGSLGFRKLGGILVETEDRKEERAVLVGLGLNLSGAPESMPRAAALDTAFNVHIELEQVIVPLAEHVLAAHLCFEEFGIESYLERWTGRSLFSSGEPVEIDTGAGMIAGAFAGVGATGALVLDTETGKREVYSGHVTAWNRRALT